MILPDFKGFPRTGRIMGIDWGATRIGVAVSDPTRDFVFARPMVRGGADAIKQIITIATDDDVVGIVVGLPLRMDGTDSDTTVAVRAFVSELGKHTNLPICMIDETLTSSAAAEQMGKMTRRDVKEKLDSQSAVIILENAIDVIKRV